MKRMPMAWWCGLLAIALGLELIIGWLLHVEAMVRIVPTSNSVSFNTAVAFVLAGIALTLPQRPFSRPLRRSIAWILILGASAVLFEDVFDIALGLDWESLHRTVADGSPRPGRVAPNTCVALLLAGLILDATEHVASAWRRVFVKLACLTQVVLCASGVFGLLLDPTLMFGWYKFNRMAAPTAFGVAILALGLFLHYEQRHPMVAVTTTELGRRIMFTGTILLLGMGLAGGLSTLVIFANYQQKSIERQLQGGLADQIRLLRRLVDEAYAQTRFASADAELTELLRLQKTARGAAWQMRVKARLSSLQGNGLSSLQLDFADATARISVGQSGVPMSMRLDLKSPQTSALLWREPDFVLQVTRDIIDADGALLAVLSIAQPLPALTAEYLKPHAMGASGELVLCGANAVTVACFPSRLNASPFFLTPRALRAALPIDDALDGRTAIRTAIDYRSKKVVAAYAPVGSTGLGVVSKVDAAELYEPINSLLGRALAVLTLSLVAGGMLLRRQIAPVIAALVESQRVARESENRAQRGERPLHAIADHMPALISYIDKDGVYRFANKTYEKWFDRPVSDILGRTPKDVLEPALFALAWPPMQAALAGEQVSFDRHTGSTSPMYPEYISVTYIPEFDAQGAVLGINVLALDVTDRHYREEDLKGLAYTDSLTGLPNRRLFSDRLEQALIRCKRSHELMALLYLDIDHFKSINDSMGHECGDRMLQEFAIRLRRTVRAADTVARLGGDEFTIIMEGLTMRESAGAVADKILAAIALPFQFESLTLTLSTSIGIAFFQQGDLTSRQYLQQSDAALYAAKAEGRNRYAIFNAPMIDKPPA